MVEIGFQDTGKEPNPQRRLFWLGTSQEGKVSHKHRADTNYSGQSLTSHYNT